MRHVRRKEAPGAKGDDGWRGQMVKKGEMCFERWIKRV